MLFFSSFSTPPMLAMPTTAMTMQTKNVAFSANSFEIHGQTNRVCAATKSTKQHVVAPVCRQGQRTAYSSGRHETVKIACEIESNPSEATYVWKFNASHTGETVDIPASLIAVDKGKSVAHYTPMTENVSSDGGDEFQ